MNGSTMTSKADLIRIRTFQTGDADSVFAVILPIQQCEFDIPISADDQPDIRDVEGFYRQGSGEFWVAEADGHIVGTIALKDIGQGQAALRKMFVAKAYRGSEFGTAHKLLATLISHAHERCVTKVLLGTTEKFLGAHRFYEKNGFVEISHTDLPEDFPRMAVDTKFYAIELS
ncbi:GNAT family N-acetyltransferase [Ochrobactrum sp. WV_118_8]|nr:GNAT family N-acetyltransferase [Brucella anthropi]MCR8491434.1 GNAT family N-acetyltransferase [Brucella anthropi]UVV70512.1 GNAT family N-acetyltransferase [Brucella anthropi]